MSINIITVLKYAFWNTKVNTRIHEEQGLFRSLENLPILYIIPPKIVVFLNFAITPEGTGLRKIKTVVYVQNMELKWVELKILPKKKVLLISLYTKKLLPIKVILKSISLTNWHRNFHPKETSLASEEFISALRNTKR